MVAGKPRDDLAPFAGHLLGAMNWPIDLLFQCVSSAVPELAEVEAAVIDGRRIHFADLVVNAARQRQPVDAASLQVVTGRAGDRVIGREPVVMKQLSSQRD